VETRSPCPVSIVDALVAATSGPSKILKLEGYGNRRHIASMCSYRNIESVELFSPLSQYHENHTGGVIALFLLNKIDAKSERGSRQSAGLDRDPGSSSSRNRSVLFAV